MKYIRHFIHKHNFHLGTAQVGIGWAGCTVSIWWSLVIKIEEYMIYIKNEMNPFLHNQKRKNYD